MKFAITEEVMTKAGAKVTWIEPGIYNVVRIFDRSRYLIDIGKETRLLTIVNQQDGTLIKN